MPGPTGVVYIASDHAGVALKAELMSKIPTVQWRDLGPTTTDSVDYPDFAKHVCEAVTKHGGLGVLICGSGIGMSIAANKVSGIRAALVSSSDLARLAREHNAANVACLGARFLDTSLAVEIVRTFLTTEPSQESRHKNRVAKISALES